MENKNGKQKKRKQERKNKMLEPINFGKVEDSQDYSPVPEGEYVAMIIAVEEKAGAKGAYINLRFAVIDGDFKGRAFFDRLFFSSEKTQSRSKLVMGRLGIDVTGVIKFDDLDKLFVGRCAFVTLEIEEYEGENKDTGEPEMKKTNRVPYSGYERMKKGFVAPDVAEFLEDSSGAQSGGDSDFNFGSNTDDNSYADANSGGNAEDDLPFDGM